MHNNHGEDKTRFRAVSDPLIHEHCTSLSEFRLNQTDSCWSVSVLWDSMRWLGLRDAHTWMKQTCGLAWTWLVAWTTDPTDPTLKLHMTMWIGFAALLLCAWHWLTLAPSTSYADFINMLPSDSNPLQPQHGYTFFQNIENVLMLALWTAMIVRMYWDFDYYIGGWSHILTYGMRSITWIVRHSWIVAVAWNLRDYRFCICRLE